jgi:hypothetical protein
MEHDFLATEPEQMIPKRERVKSFARASLIGMLHSREWANIGETIRQRVPDNFAQ